MTVAYPTLRTYVTSRRAAPKPSVLDQAADRDTGNMASRRNRPRQGHADVDQ